MITIFNNSTFIKNIDYVCIFFIVDSLWAITIVVLLSFNTLIPFCIICSVLLSMLAVASSSINIFGSLTVPLQMILIVFLHLKNSYHLLIFHNLDHVVLWYIGFYKISKHFLALFLSEHTLLAIVSWNKNTSWRTIAILSLIHFELISFILVFPIKISPFWFS